MVERGFENPGEKIDWGAFSYLFIRALFSQFSAKYKRDITNPLALLRLSVEEATFAVICMIGDWVLADKWLAMHARSIRFDFQLVTFCDAIEQVGVLNIDGGVAVVSVHHKTFSSYLHFQPNLLPPQCLQTTYLRI